MGQECVHGLFAMPVVSSSARCSNSRADVKKRTGQGCLSSEPLFAEMCTLTNCCLAENGERQHKSDVSVKTYLCGTKILGFEGLCHLTKQSSVILALQIFYGPGNEVKSMEIRETRSPTVLQNQVTGLKGGGLKRVGDRHSRR